MAEQDQTTIVVVILVVFCVFMSAGVAAYIYFNDKARAWFKKTFGLDDDDDGNNPPPPDDPAPPTDAEVVAPLDSAAATPTDDTAPTTPDDTADSNPDPAPVPSPGKTCTATVNAPAWKKGSKKFVPYNATECPDWCGWSARDHMWYRSKNNDNKGYQWYSGNTGNNGSGCPTDKKKIYEPFQTGTYKIVNTEAQQGLICDRTTKPGHIILTKFTNGTYYMQYTGGHSKPCDKKYIKAADKTGGNIKFEDGAGNDGRGLWSFVPVGDGTYNIVNWVNKKNPYLTIVDIEKVYGQTYKNIFPLGLWHEPHSKREAWKIWT